MQSLDEQLAGMSESLCRPSATRPPASPASSTRPASNASRALAAARQAQTVALGEQAAQYQSELDAQQQQHAAAVQGMQDQLDAQTEQAHEHAARQQQILADTEENARLDTCSCRRPSRRPRRTPAPRSSASPPASPPPRPPPTPRFQRLGQVIEHNAEQAQASADDAARKRRELNIDELSNALDRAEALLLKRKQAAQHAQQALAVALRVLDDGSDAT